MLEELKQRVYEANMQLPKHGAYVLVLLHPVCEVAVRRFIY